MLDPGQPVSTAVVQLAGAAMITPADIAAELGPLDQAVRAAVSSFAGLHLMITLEGCPLTFVLFSPPVPPTHLMTSIRIPLAPAAGPGVDGTTVLLYATSPGAFVDLAADLTLALGLGPPRTGGGQDGTTAGDRAVVQLDADLPARSTDTAVLGLEEFDLVQQAIGVLIDRGLTPDAATATLTDQARAAGSDLPTHARQILDAPAAPEDPPR